MTQYLNVESQSPVLIHSPPTVRETTRRVAFEQELQGMVRLSAGLEPSPPLQLKEQWEVPVDRTALERMQRDARFRLPRRQVRRLLEHFSGEQAAPESSPHTLVIVAHQDDESIGIGGQLARLQNVTIVHVTNGAPRDPAQAQRFGFDHPDDYAAARRREAIVALGLAGVPPERIICLGIQDGEAEHQMVRLSYTIAELIDGMKPDVVVTHPYEGGHTDHDAISFAVQLACGVLRREGAAQPAVLELTSYHNHEGRRIVSDFLPFGPQDDVRTIRLAPELQKIKADMYRCFKSQLVCLSQFPTEIERLRPAPRYNYTEAPHAGQLDYERFTKQRLSGLSWRKRASAALRELRAEAGSIVAV